MVVADRLGVFIRPYRPGDDAEQTHTAFWQAMVRTAAADYDPAQIEAWAGPRTIDLAHWDARRVAAHTFVAALDDPNPADEEQGAERGRQQVVGFADFLDDGLLDMLFVHPDFTQRGVARRLVEVVRDAAKSAGLVTLHTHASRTARPAFERLGFGVVAERPDDTVNGRVVPNYAMQRIL